MRTVTYKQKNSDNRASCGTSKISSSYLSDLNFEFGERAPAIERHLHEGAGLGERLQSAARAVVELTEVHIHRHTIQLHLIEAPGASKPSDIVQIAARFWTYWDKSMDHWVSGP